jgi:4-hydroxybenzoate polyprenyltransferase
MRTSVIPLSPTSSRTPALRYLACLRVQDILALQGSPLLGAAFALGQPTADQIRPLAILAIANVCLVAHVFMLNDWADVRADLGDPNKAAGVFTARGADRDGIAVLTVGLLALGLFLVSQLGPATLLLSAAIAGLSALYSLSPFRWKCRPLLNSVAHLAGGALHFLLGYSIGHALDRRGLILAIFFGLTFAAGHLTQEIRDHHGDVLNAIRTNAVAFGRRRTFIASVILFTLAHALLFVFALQGILPRPLAVLSVLYPVHLRWSFESLAEGLTYDSICRLQTRYRALFALVGVAMVTALWLV